jgi:hypothetical protein
MPKNDCPNTDQWADFGFVIPLTLCVTTWIRVLLEKLIAAQLVKKLPTSYISRRFITVEDGCLLGCSAV